MCLNDRMYLYPLFFVCTMTVTAQDLVDVAQRNGTFYDDLVGLGRRIARNKGADVANSESFAEIAAYAVLDYHQMWHSVGNAYDTNQSKHWRAQQIHSLYGSCDPQDDNPHSLNPTLIALDYLLTLNAHMRLEASQKNTHNAEQDWYVMQDTLAERLARLV